MKEVATLAEMGDLSENAAYQIAKGKLRGINQRILDIEAQLKRAIIIKNKPGSTTVQLGSTVTVEINGQEKRYLLLGSSEVNPLNNIISHNSPLGTVLMGKKINETFSVPLKDKVLKGKIISIT
jgi:transcription elongation factor GreA